MGLLCPALVRSPRSDSSAGRKKLTGMFPAGSFLDWGLFHKFGRDYDINYT